MVGPVFGAWLYVAGGMALPFLIAAGVEFGYMCLAVVFMVCDRNASI